MGNFFDQIVLWYGGLPGPAQTAVTVVVGAVVAYLAFKIAVQIAKRVVSAVITAVIVFLLTTVPGHAIMTSAYERIQQQVSNSNVDMDRVGQFGGQLKDQLLG